MSRGPVQTRLSILQILKIHEKASCNTSFDKIHVWKKLHEAYIEQLVNLEAALETKVCIYCMSLYESNEELSYEILIVKFIQALQVFTYQHNESASLLN